MPEWQEIELRRRAKHYRTRAEGPMPWAVVAQLERFAEECEHAAAAGVAADRDEPPDPA